MTPDQAAWVRNHVWTSPVHELHKRSPFIGGGIQCLCQEPFTCARCAGGQAVDHRADSIRFHAPDTVVVDASGVVYEVMRSGQEAPLAVWLADRICTQRCSGPPQEVVPALASAAPPSVQLDLFAGVAG